MCVMRPHLAAPCSFFAPDTHSPPQVVLIAVATGKKQPMRVLFSAQRSFPTVCDAPRRLPAPGARADRRSAGAQRSAMNAAAREALHEYVLSATLPLMYDRGGSGKVADLAFIAPDLPVEQFERTCRDAVAANVKGGDLVLYLELPKPGKGGAACGAAKRPHEALAAGGSTARDIAALRAGAGQPQSAADAFQDGSKLSVTYYSLAAKPAAAGLPERTLWRWALGVEFATEKWADHVDKPPPDSMVLNGPAWPMHPELCKLKLPPPGTKASAFSRMQCASAGGGGAGGGFDAAGLAAAVAAAVQAPFMAMLGSPGMRGAKSFNRTAARGAQGLSSCFVSYTGSLGVAPQPPPAAFAAGGLPQQARAVKMRGTRDAESSAELSFKQGEVMSVAAAPPGFVGWLCATTLNGRTGLVPDSWTEPFCGAPACASACFHSPHSRALPCSASTASATSAAASATAFPAACARPDGAAVSLCDQCHEEQQRLGRHGQHAASA